MDQAMLHFGAYGLIFFLGLVFVLRPLMILTSLIFRPGFLALVVLVVLGGRAALLHAPDETAPIIAGSLLAFAIGAGAGFPLRFLTRGVL